MNNPYASRPLRVIFFRPAAGPDGARAHDVAVHVFLTQTPKKVSDALRKSWDSPSSPHGKTVYGHFSRDQIPRLKSVDRSLTDWLKTDGAVGGAVAPIDLFGDFDDPQPELVPDGSRKSSQNPISVGKSSWPGLYYHDVDVYPDDTLFELKRKVFVATGVPLYRQHLFYISQDGFPRNTYKVSVGSPVIVDARTLFDPPLGAGTDSVGNPADLPIDRLMEENRQELKIEPYDTFQVLEVAPKVFIEDVFVLDLFDVVPPLSLVSNSVLRLAVDDPYQFGQIYYGLVVKYWPMLTPDAFRLAVTSPDQMENVYPLIAPNERAEKARHERLVGVCRDAYGLGSILEEGSYSITRATIHVSGGAKASQRVDVRNVFDWIPATCDWPIMGVSFGGTPGNERVPRTVVKQNVTVCSVNVQDIAKKIPKDPNVTFIYPRNFQTNRFTAMTIRQNGDYLIRSDWDGEKRMGFAEATKDFARFAAPILDRVNAMGGASILAGQELTPPRPAKSVQASRFGALDMHVIWKMSMTDAGFRLIRKRLVALERVDVLELKSGDSAGGTNAVAFYFRKGDVFSPECLERMIAAQTARERTIEQKPINLYEYLTDDEVGRRWASVFRGRIVTITHRTTDLKIEYSCSDSHEVRYIHMYVSGFLEAAVRSEEFAPELGQSRTYREDKLRMLQERDPELFDLRRHDPDSKLYSVLCQSDRQPLMLTPEEAKKASSGTGASRMDTVKYWNFTENAVQHYACDTKAYPHMSFRVGEHPLGYCLPCCKKVEPQENTRGEFIQARCLEQRTWTDGDEDLLRDSLGSSFGQQRRHILMYGKDVPVGRVSMIPQTLENGLFFGTAPPGFAYRLVGVDQNLPAIPKAGYAFSVARALEMDLGELVMGFVATVQKMGALYTSVGFGSGKAFKTNTELSSALVEAFVDRSPGFSTFGAGGKSATTWREMFESLLYFAHNVVVITIVDSTGYESLSLRVHPKRFESLSNGSARGIILVESPAGVYPFALIDQKAYVRMSKSLNMLWSREAVVGVLERIVGKETSPAAHQSVDYGLLKKFCAKSEGRSIVHKYANNRNLCYGVLLKINKARLFVPVRYEVIQTDGVPVVHGFVDRADLSDRGVTTRAAREINSFIAGSRSLSRAYDPIEFAAELVHKAKAVALVPKAGIHLSFNFYHQPCQPEPARYDQKPIEYDVFQINRVLYKSASDLRRSELPEGKRALSFVASYKNYLYDLFVAEFVSSVKSEKNQKLRRRIDLAIGQANIANRRGIIALKEEIERILSGESAGDIDLVWDVFMGTYENVGLFSGVKDIVIEKLASNVFDFDRSTFNSIRSWEEARVRKFLSKYMRELVLLTKKEVVAEMGNILVPCASETDVPQGQCKKGKLVVPEEKFAEFVDILASDITNPHLDIFGKVGAVIDPLRFISRPEEQLTFV